MQHSHHAVKESSSLQPRVVQRHAVGMRQGIKCCAVALGQDISSLSGNGYTHRNSTGGNQSPSTPSEGSVIGFHERPPLHTVCDGSIRSRKAGGRTQEKRAEAGDKRAEAVGRASVFLVLRAYWAGTAVRWQRDGSLPHFQQNKRVKQPAHTAQVLHYHNPKVVPILAHLTEHHV